MQALPAASESLCIVEMGGTESKEETGETGTVGGLFLNTGLQVCAPFGQGFIQLLIKILGEKSSSKFGEKCLLQ